MEGLLYMVMGYYVKELEKINAPQPLLWKAAIPILGKYAAT
jgi:hypothetical protein